MSALFVYEETQPERLLFRSSEFADIAQRLAAVGIAFERWKASAALAEQATQADILQAYASDIERVQRERGYCTADVVRLRRDATDAEWPSKAQAARAKFLEEHRHAEDEVRFFVEGSGMFYLRVDGKVHIVLCERDDLLSVPAGVRHWFDMGKNPGFCTIRIFGSPDGWVAQFTGDQIAQSFPSYDEMAAQ